MEIVPQSAVVKEISGQGLFTIPDALRLHNLTAGRILEFLKASAQQSAEIRVNLDPRRTSHSGLRSQFISDLVRHWKWVYGSGFCDGAYKVDMRQSCEIANIVLATALLPKPIYPLIRRSLANGNKRSRLPPCSAKTTMMKVSKLCMTSFYNVKEFFGLQEI